MIIIGIDPGVGGAICKWSNKFLSVDKCPDSAGKMSSIVSSITNSSYVDGDGNCVAYLEKVWSFPTDGKVGLFTFGENYGRWQGVIESHKIPINYITPKKWMKYWEEEYDIKLPKEKKERKHKLRELASYQTDIKTTLWNSDAILIAAYGYKIEQEIR